jgi:hypothetical protein
MLSEAVRLKEYRRSRSIPIASGTASVLLASNA